MSNKYREVLATQGPKVYMRVDFRWLRAFVAENPRTTDFKIKVTLYDARTFAKGVIVAKEDEVQFCSSSASVKSFKCEAELVKAICSRKYFEAISAKQQ